MLGHVAWEAVMELAAQRASGPQSRRAAGEVEVGNQAREEWSQRRAPPVLTPVASASEQFSGRGTQEVTRAEPK